ncbi:GATA transcription factor 1-like protein [Carex littledalei]|uniref:GATA transcription factor 1-like protein n=1 Tax=Carex littledalei TaxID=544730 RepID=A0A833QUI7_9POAL|nr:GATA transcription factor 1-like protein [Carex littledalei]
MGEAVDKPAAPATPTPEEEPAVVAGALGPEGCLADDFLLFLEDSIPVLSGDAKQGKKEGVEAQEEEEEELEWLSNIDAFPFPPLDTSLEVEASAVMEALDTMVVDELEIKDMEEQETKKVRVPKKRRSQVPRRPRKDFSNFPLLSVGESSKEKQPSIRRCTHCLMDDTPQWRQGPEGPGTLCNACGVRYKSGRLYDEYRPANSPTFNPGMHSNFHRKVLEMRGGVNSSTRGGRRSSLGGGEWGGEVHDSGGGT